MTTLCSMVKSMCTKFHAKIIIRNYEGEVPKRPILYRVNQPTWFKRLEQMKINKKGSLIFHSQ